MFQDLQFRWVKFSVGYELLEKYTVKGQSDIALRFGIQL